MARRPPRGHRNRVRLVVSRPGKPTDNAFAESFNGRFRDECLDRPWFASLQEARQTVEAWRVEEDTAPASGSGAAQASGLPPSLTGWRA